MQVRYLLLISAACCGCLTTPEVSDSGIEDTDVSTDASDSGQDAKIVKDSGQGGISSSITSVTCDSFRIEDGANWTPMTLPVSPNTLLFASVETQINRLDGVDARLFYNRGNLGGFELGVDPSAGNLSLVEVCAVDFAADTLNSTRASGSITAGMNYGPHCEGECMVAGDEFVLFDFQTKGGNLNDQYVVYNGAEFQTSSDRDLSYQRVEMSAAAAIERDAITITDETSSASSTLQLLDPNKVSYFYSSRTDTDQDFDALGLSCGFGNEGIQCKRASTVGTTSVRITAVVWTADVRVVHELVEWQPGTTTVPLPEARVWYSGQQGIYGRAVCADSPQIPSDCQFRIVEENGKFKAVRKTANGAAFIDLQGFL